MRSKRFAAAAVAALVLSGCSDDGGNGTPSPSPGEPELPSTAIGQCQTVPDFASEPAAPKGVNYAAQLRDQGVLTIGSDIPFPPFSSVDEATGEPAGFDVDLGNEIADRLGLEAKWVGADFEALFSTTLPQGRFDIGLSAIAVKPERQDTIDFTIPYFKADLSLTVEEGSAIRAVEDLKDRVIGAERDTAAAECATAVSDLVGAKEVELFRDPPKAFDGLLDGRVAGVLDGLPAARGIVEQRSGLEIVQRIETQEVYAIAIGEQKPDLRVAINEKLQELFDDGTYATIYEKWFGTPPPFDLPPVDLKG